MLSRCVAALSALACVSATPLPYTPATQTGILATEHPEIVRVDCLTGRGTAFRVGPDLLLSVNHVTSLGGCFIDGVPITIAYHGGDFSILTAPKADKWLKVDCGGFVAGRKYLALGFARGLDTQTEITGLTATGDRVGSFSVLQGVLTVVPGQSGGPILDEATGTVVGTVNIYDAQRGLSGSLALKDTPICKS